MRIWSRANRIGLVMTMVLGAANIVFGLINLPMIMNPPTTTVEGPPSGVLLLDLALGVIMVAAAAVAWSTVNRRAATIASVANILQGLTALPAFFGAPIGWQVIAGITIAWTAVSVALTLSRSKGAAPVE